MSQTVRKTEQNETYSERFTPRVFSGVNSIAFIHLVMGALGREATQSMREYYLHQEKHSEFSTNPDLRASLLEEYGIPNIIFEFYRNHFPQLPTNPELMSMQLVKKKKEANEVVNEIREIVFPEMEEQFGFLNSVQHPGANLTFSAEHFLGNGYVDERLKFELKRQELIQILLLQLESDYHEHRINEKMHAVNQIFEQYLYEGKHGETHPITLYSAHANGTNKSLAYQRQKPESLLVQDSHWKEHNLLTRQIPDIGPVLSHFREKGNTSAVVKALYKALIEEPNNTISSDKVKDVTGFMFVALNPESQTKLYHELQNLLCNHLDNCRVEADHHVGKSRGQSEGINWYRIQVYFGENHNYPVEIIIFNPLDYFNYRYQVGTKTETGEIDYSNALAHEMFVRRRTIEVGEMLFPKEFYPRDSNEIEEARQREEEKLVKELSLEKTYNN